MFFDSASRTVCTVIPTRTNTPLHALATLNDITYVEAARVMAETILTAKKTDEQRLSDVFVRLLSRPPSSEESSILLAGLERHRRAFQENPADAAELLMVGEFPSRSHLPQELHAAWTAICLAVINLDEALTKE